MKNLRKYFPIHFRVIFSKKHLNKLTDRNSKLHLIHWGLRQCGQDFQKCYFCRIEGDSKNTPNLNAKFYHEIGQKIFSVSDF